MGRRTAGATWMCSLLWRTAGRLWERERVVQESDVCMSPSPAGSGLPERRGIQPACQTLARVPPMPQRPTARSGQLDLLNTLLALSCRFAGTELMDGASGSRAGLRSPRWRWCQLTCDQCYPLCPPGGRTWGTATMWMQDRALGNEKERGAGCPRRNVGKKLGILSDPGNVPAHLLFIGASSSENRFTSLDEVVMS